MILAYEGKKMEGNVVDCRSLSVGADAVLAAIRGEASAVTIEASSPGPGHEHVGYVRSGMTVSVRTALAAAARSRGLSAPQDDDLAAARAELAAMDPPAVETRAERERAATERGETARLRERVAELRGQLQATRDRDGDTSAVESELATAVRDLSEAETAQVAARQRLEQAREQAREARDARERRLRLEDRVANFERAARAALVDQIEESYTEAVDAVPGETPADPFAAEGVTAALAIARVADLSAPVVLACGPFDSPSRAADWLDAPVVRL